MLNKTNPNTTKMFGEILFVFLFLKPKNAHVVCIDSDVENDGNE